MKVIKLVNRIRTYTLRILHIKNYTSSISLGLCRTFKDSTGENHTVLSSASICENAWCTAVNENLFLAEEVHEVGGGKKRTRRRGKYTQQERERIRFVVPRYVSYNLNVLIPEFK